MIFNQSSYFKTCISWKEFMFICLKYTLYFRSFFVQKYDVGKERVVYYLSKTFHDAKTTFTLIEIFYFIIIYNTGKLKHYLITNTTYIVAQDDQLMYFLCKT